MTTVSIPKSLVEKIKRKPKLEKSLGDIKEKKENEVYSAEEEKKVKERLKRLGYLD